MAIELSEAQRKAMTEQPDVPLELTDPVTHASYVLVPSQLYKRIRPFLEDEVNIRDTYAAQTESASRAGWNDPMMDEYNDYDAHRKQS